MSEFERLFNESKGRSVLFNGREIHLMDRFTIKDGDTVVIQIESTNSEWRQGLKISTKGTFEVNNQTIDKNIVLWEDTAPATVKLKVHTKENDIKISNVWDIGNGTMQFWHNGAAMLIDEITSFKKRYSCNDGHPDENFDDIVFTVEKR